MRDEGRKKTVFFLPSSLIPELRRQLQRLRLASARLNETLEELHVQRRGGFRLGMPLHADAEPLRIHCLNCFNHTVRRDGSDAKLLAQLAHSLMMPAVDTDFA